LACRSILPALACALLALAAPAYAQNAEIDFGDDASQWANDGECDDPRFEGPAMPTILTPKDIGHDASDCQAAFEAGEITFADDPAPADPAACDTIDYGDDGSLWSNDGECDDPRFAGPAMHGILLDSDLGHDATDCRTLCEQGLIYPRDAGAAQPGPATPALDILPPVLNDTPAPPPGRSRLGRG